MTRCHADRILIEVLPTDTYVEVSSGTLKPWDARYIGPGIQLDGTWLAGTEIGFGTYLITPHSSGSTYWDLDADVNGDTIIDNDYTTGQSYLPLNPPAKAVVIHGVWVQ